MRQANRTIKDEASLLSDGALVVCSLLLWAVILLWVPFWMLLCSCGPETLMGQTWTFAAIFYFPVLLAIGFFQERRWKRLGNAALLASAGFLGIGISMLVVEVLDLLSLARDVSDFVVVLVSSPIVLVPAAAAYRQREGGFSPYAWMFTLGVSVAPFAFVWISAA